MARKRKTKLKKVRLQKQIGGTGPLGSRGRELPPKEFEDAGVPRELPPTATPMPTAAPVPDDGQAKTDPNLDSQKQQQQSESDRREAEKRQAEQDRKRAEEARKKAMEEAAKKAAEEAAQQAAEDFDGTEQPEIGDRITIGGVTYEWNGTTYVKVEDEDTGSGDEDDDTGSGDEDDDDEDDDDEDDDDTTPPPQEPTEEELREAALRKQVADRAEGKLPEDVKVPDAKPIIVGEDEVLGTQEMDPLEKRVEFTDVVGVDPETVAKVESVATADEPLEVKVEKILEVVEVPENVAIQIAKGEVSNIASAIEVAKINQIRGASVNVEEGALASRVVGVLSPEAKAVAAKNAGTTLARVTRAKKQLRNAGLSEADINELGNDPELLEARLTEFTEQERGIIAGLPEEALVSNQFDSLISGMENGEIPAWAKPAVEAVEANLAQRGLSVSSVGRDALLNQIFRAALPIAQANAQAIQQSVAQQKSIEAQAAEADAQRQQQVALDRANKAFGLDMAQFNADQQRELSNSRFLQTVSITNANNEQRSILQQAVLMSQANIADANFAQQAQIQNAKNFLSMDLANLNAEQQANVLTAQQEQQRILSNQAAENARRQFNATSDMQVQQFNANLAATVEQFNASQTNAIEQFNATQINAAAARDSQREADLNRLNAQLAIQVDQFNSNQDFAREEFNARNRAAVEASNVQWRRQVNTANTAAQNAVNMQNAMNAFNMSQTSLSFMWQELRDKADYDFRSAENTKNRIAQLVNTALASDPNKYGSSSEALKGLIDLILQDIGG